MPEKQHHWYRDATPKQIFARKRNWERGRLMGMIGNLHHFETLSNPEKDCIEAAINRLQIVIDDWEHHTTSAKKVSKLGKRLELI